MDTLGNMTPDDYQRMANTLGGVSAGQEQNNALEKQLEFIKALRQGPSGHMAGQVYVGNNALQSLAPIAEAYAGKQSIDKMNQLAQQQQQARSMMMQMYLRRAGMGGAGSPTGVDPNESNDSQNPVMFDPNQQSGPAYA